MRKTVRKREREQKGMRRKYSYHLVVRTLSKRWYWCGRFGLIVIISTAVVDGSAVAPLDVEAEERRAAAVSEANGRETFKGEQKAERTGESTECKTNFDRDRKGSGFVLVL